ncbi:MAG TPA: tripartite tricarboxylate transporter substrate-binding protein [Stellaceae bacterium]|nr:tripartite tricarboxylate transporter substrate-binding protein [Stellaceae bacterium]
MSRLRSLAGGLAAMAAVLGLAGTARAESAADFYKTHPNLTILVGVGPGSSYEIWAQVVARYMSKHMPGNPRFIVTEMPGAGSLIMANYLYRSAPQDGTYIGSFSPSLPAEALLGLPNVRFDPTKFQYIGSPESSNHACVVSAATGVKTVADAQAKQVLVGGNGPTTVPSYMPPILDDFIGTKFKVIEGYKTVPEVLLAMDRGEVGGICSKLDTLMSSEADALKSGKLTMLFTMNQKREPSFPNVPSAFEFVKDPAKRKMLAFLRSSIELGRPYVAPPGVPADRLALLRQAFEDTAKDPDFIAAVKKLKRVVTLTSGAELQNMVAQLMDTPKPVVAQAKAMLPAGIGE